MKNKVAKNSKIEVQVGLGADGIPEKITWVAPGNPNGPGQQECKAMMLSVFDKEAKDTLKIDLWTKEMQVAEMDRFVYQTLRALADTYQRATQNTALANDMQRFALYFGEQTEIVPK
ncbi:MAG: gliding motility protein GldC [Phaeodactylibacter sp.]|nr:gliding motility protein GldC [Phaeodactylibacter sp.]MCB9301056.1 gliding motility protein GldC [Lewinellaceae bacterium]